MQNIKKVLIIKNSISIFLSFSCKFKNFELLCLQVSTLQFWQTQSHKSYTTNIRMLVGQLSLEQVLEVIKLKKDICLSNEDLVVRWQFHRPKRLILTKKNYRQYRILVFLAWRSFSTLELLWENRDNKSATLLALP